MGFVFFDVETTGLRIGFDQIIHFAAIRTDLDLKEVDRFEIRSRLMRHVIPHPSALLTNRVPINLLLDSSLPSHYDMACQIRAKLLAWSPSIFIGYNSIGFDEEMVRQAFFQTLLDPYLTSKHDNGRADAFGLALAAAALSPGCLAIPTSPEGRPTFKLEMIAPANGAAHDKAHDAMADVNATLHLCRCIKERAPEVWNRAIQFSTKKSTAYFVDGGEPFMLTEFFANEAYHAAVFRIGVDPDNPNGRFCLDLSHDVGWLASLSNAELTAALQTKPSPVRKLRINAAPVIAPLFEAPDGLLKVDIAVAEERASFLANDPHLMARIATAYIAGRAEWPPSPHVEDQIYDGFAGPDDEWRMADFHKIPWERRAGVVEEFDDARMRTIGRRLVYFERRGSLSEEARREVEQSFSDRLAGVGETNDTGLSIWTALAETERLIAIAPSALLQTYRDYLLERLLHLSRFRPREASA